MLLCRIMRAENGDLRAYGVDGIELREHAKRRRAHLTGDEQSDRSPDRDRDSKGRIIPRRMRRHPASRRSSVAHAVHGSVPMVHEEKFGAGDRTRTDDLLITNQLLYQLSYAGLRRANIGS